MKRIVLPLLLLILLIAGYAKREAIYWKIPPRFTEPLVGLVSGFRVDYNVMIPMRDGVRLATDIFYPTRRQGRLGTILIRTPYSKERAFLRGGGFSPSQFVEQGYVVAIQDVRGKFASEGTMLPYQNDGPDGSDTVNWIAKQPWSNGRVGSFGCSSGGELQMLLARERNPHHAAMIALSPGGALGSAMGQHTFGSYDGGIFNLESIFGWFVGNGGKTGSARLVRKVDKEAATELPTISLVRKFRDDPTDYEDYLSKPFADAYWNKLDYIGDSARFATPTLIVDAWLDPRVGDTLRMAELMQRNWEGRTPAPELHMILAPGGHCGYFDPAPAGKIGDLPADNVTQPYADWFKRFFAYWLRGDTSQTLALPRYRFFVLGENRWVDSPAWPPTGVTYQRWFLDGTSPANTASGGGLLRPAGPPPQDRTDEFSYDPANPVPSCLRHGGAKCLNGHVDQGEIEARHDVLVYTSPPLQQPLRIAGPLSAELYLSSSAPDTDVIARLVDVWPDGKALNIQEGALRMRYRDGFTTPHLMTPGKTYLARIDMRAIAYYLPAGHRLRLDVTSSNFPRLERNLNTGGNNYDETVGIVAINRIHMDASRPSAVIIPEWTPADRTGR